MMIISPSISIVVYHIASLSTVLCRLGVGYEDISMMIQERELEQHEDKQEQESEIEQRGEEAPVDSGRAGGSASKTTMTSKNERTGHRLRGRQMS
jgi:hypothetical protein